MSSSAANNSYNGTEYNSAQAPAPPEPPPTDTAKILVLSLMILLTLLGNGYVFTSIVWRSRRRSHHHLGSAANNGPGGVGVSGGGGRMRMSRMYYFMLHLSVADMLTALLTLLSEVIWTLTAPSFYGGNLVCKAVKFLQMVGPYLSSYVLLMTAVDRYQAICHPLTNLPWASKKSKLMILVAWVISLLLCIPQTIVFATPDQAPYKCVATFAEGWGVKAYVTWFSFSNFFVPLLVLIFCYVQICCAIWTNFSSQRPDPVICLPRASTATMTATTTLSTYVEPIRGRQASHVSSEPANHAPGGDVGSVRQQKMQRLSHADADTDAGSQEACALSPSAEAGSNNHSGRRQQQLQHLSPPKPNHKSPGEVANPLKGEAVEVEVEVGGEEKRRLLESREANETPAAVTNNAGSGRAADGTCPAGPNKSPAAVHTINNNKPGQPSPASGHTPSHGHAHSNGDHHVHGHGHAHTHDHGITRAKLRSIQQTVSVILLFIVCSTPFICVQLWAVWGQPSQGVISSVAWLYWLLTLNSVVNPWIYMAFNRELRSPVVRLLLCRKRKRRQSDAYVL